MFAEDIFRGKHCGEGVGKSQSGSPGKRRRESGSPEDAFTKLWQSRQTLATEGSIKAWLYSAVRNASIDHLRKVKRLRVSESGLQSATTIEQSVVHTIIQTETIDHIVQTIGKLPPQCRRIFRLFYLQGKSYNEIAQELNLSPQTVRNQKQRATKLLRKMILPLFFLLSVYSLLY
jgi:RNA polymerase sigma-70 factor (family 1)